MDAGRLDSLDCRIVRLRLAVDAYAVVCEHLDALFQADIRPTGYDFVEIVSQIAKGVDGLAVGADQPAAFYHEQLQDVFRSLQNRLKAQKHSQHFAEIVGRMGTSLRPRSEAECAAFLDEVMGQG